MPVETPKSPDSEKEREPSPIMNGDGTDKTSSDSGEGDSGEGDSGEGDPGEGEVVQKADEDTTKNMRFK
jgi:hypothetical protein